MLSSANPSSVLLLMPYNLLICVSGLTLSPPFIIGVNKLALLVHQIVHSADQTLLELRQQQLIIHFLWLLFEPSFPVFISTALSVVFGLLHCTQVQRWSMKAELGLQEVVAVVPALLFDDVSGPFFVDFVQIQIVLQLARLW